MRRSLCVSICALICLALIAGPALAADTVTIVGTVNADYQIVAENDQVYEVGEGEKGDEVVELVDKKVRVTGMVEESEGAKVITVISYEVLEE